ncbi:MAG: dienelactone hydrolase family protein [Bacteroidia bacterium]|nr:dienelactone hydrolase family protein [Bacteroidia bacterium]
MKLIYTFILLNSLGFNTILAQLKPVSYNDGAQKLNGLYGTPKKALAKKPGVLILPAWMGIDDNSKSAATRLNELGYHTFVADIYGEGNYPKDMKGAAEQSTIYKSNVKLYRQRIELAKQKLIEAGADPNNIVVIGFCFGGTGALEAARAKMNVKGVVSFHGGLARDTSKAIEPIQPKVLVCHGADDFFVPEAQVRGFQNEMRAAKADWQMVYYADAVHAFTDVNAGNDPKKGVAYNEKAAKRSWDLMLRFFEEILK